MIDFEQPEWRNQIKEVTGLVGDLPACLCESTGQLVVSDQPKFQQYEMQRLQRREVVFIQHLVDEEQPILLPARPVELDCGPVHELALECLALRQAGALRR